MPYDSNGYYLVDREIEKEHEKWADGLLDSGYHYSIITGKGNYTDKNSAFVNFFLTLRILGLFSN